MEIDTGTFGTKQYTNVGTELLNIVVNKDFAGVQFQFLWISILYFFPEWKVVHFKRMWFKSIGPKNKIASKDTDRPMQASVLSGDISNKNHKDPQFV